MGLLVCASRGHCRYHGLCAIRAELYRIGGVSVRRIAISGALGACCCFRVRIRSGVVLRMHS